MMCLYELGLVVGLDMSSGRLDPGANKPILEPDFMGKNLAKPKHDAVDKR